MVTSRRLAANGANNSNSADSGGKSIINSRFISYDMELSAIAKFSGHLVKEDFIWKLCFHIMRSNSTFICFMKHVILQNLFYCVICCLNCAYVIMKTVVLVKSLL